MYDRGKGVPWSLNKARKHFTQAAMQNHPEAMYRLGMVMQKLRVDGWMQHVIASASAGCSLAKFYLTQYHYRSNDFDETYKWAKDLVNGISGTAQYYLGDILYRGGERVELGRALVLLSASDGNEWAESHDAIEDYRAGKPISDTINPCMYAQW